MRIVNNTLPCIGPWIALYKETPPDLPWAEVPEEWIEEGHVTFKVAKGTLVPLVTLLRGPLPASLKRSRSPESISDEEGKDVSIDASDANPFADYECTADGPDFGSSSSHGAHEASAVLPHHSTGAEHTRCVKGEAPEEARHRTHTEIDAIPAPSEQSAQRSAQFMHDYVEIHRTMAGMIEERLRDSDSMRKGEMHHLSAQLSISRSLLSRYAAARSGDALFD